MRRTSSRCSIRIHPGQNGRCTVVTEKFQNQNVQIFGYVYQSTDGQNHGPVWKIQSFLSKGICTVFLWQDCYRKGNSRKFFLKDGREKFQIGNVCSLTEKKDYSCLCMWTILKISWKETKNQSDVEDTHERRWFGRTDIIPWPCWFGLYSTRKSNKQRYCGQLQKYVWIQDFCRSSGKPASFREIGCEYFLMVLWHGRSCKEMRGKILRTGEQNNSTVTQSRNAMPWWPPKERRRNGISWRIV